MVNIDNIKNIKKFRPRSDAKLLNLPEENIAKLRDALFDGMKYSDACPFILKEFGVSVCPSTVGDFWQAKCIPFLEDRRASALREARSFGAEAKKHPGCFDQVAQDALQQTAYSMSLNPGLALPELRVLRGLLFKERALAVQEERLKLEQRRADLADRALKKLEEPKSKLSYQEQSAKLREMFGMACANTGRPPKKEPDAAPNHLNLNLNPNHRPLRDPDSTAETVKAGSPDPAVPTSASLSTLKAGSPDPAAPPSDTLSNQTREPTES